MAHPNPSGSTAVDLIHGPAADLLWLVVNNLPSYIAIETLLSFLKDTFCDADMGSTAPSQTSSTAPTRRAPSPALPRGKIPSALPRGKRPSPTSGSAPYSRALPRGRSPSATTWSASRVCAPPTGMSPSVTSEETHDLFISVVHNVMLYMCNYLMCSTFHQSSFKRTDRNAYICLLLSLL